jgi:pimeloyl-ACP methyl ester carboxylesterase
MGVVYRARDTRLGRHVAVKMLPDAFAQDAVRLGRFLREARTLASLNHPNIAAIYGLEEADGRQYLIMECVEGESLESQIARGPIPLKPALRLALQVARALEAAHEKGVIHRDLKPANIKLTPADQVKVLDFGLAKGSAPASIGSSAMTAPPGASLSIPGAIMGTAGYMSPEQARGSPVDQRTDLFAFGCILFEMLAGKSAFGRASVIDSITAALHDEPDLTCLPPETPELVRFVVQRCLAKDPRDRLHHVSDVRILLESAETPGAAGGPTAPASARAEPIVHAFTISSEICRQLHRGSFDPRLIGHEMQYADNHTNSDVLVVLLHSLTRDHRQWFEVLGKLPFRGVAPTQVGFEPDARVRPKLSLRDHVILHRALVRRLQEQLAPASTVLVGYSSGADIAMRFVADPGEVPPVHGLIALEVGTSNRTLHISSQFAQLEPGDDDVLLRKVRELGATADSIHSWTTLHNYLLSMVLKMRNDLSVIRDFSREIMAQFPTDDASTFAGWYRAASKHVRELRCVVGEGDDYHRDLQALRLEHLDTNCLGDRHRDENIVIEPGVSHRDLNEASRVLRYIEEVVGKLRNSKGA